MLPGIPDIGIFRLETGSYFAAQELPPAIEMAREFGGPHPGGVLALEPMERKVKGQPTRKFHGPGATGAGGNGEAANANSGGVRACCRGP